MKPIHEQEWTYRGLFGDVIGEDGHSLTADGAGDDALRLISAATDMARALLAFLPEDGHTMECGNSGVNDVLCSTECRDARQALRKAGVLP